MAEVSNNPFLKTNQLPVFSQLAPEMIEPAVQYMLQLSRERIAVVEAVADTPSWDNFAAVLDEIDDQLNSCWSTVSHLFGVSNSDEIRAAYEACLPLLTEYQTEQGQNKIIYNGFLKLRDSAEFNTLDNARKQSIDNAIRDFRLSGVALDEQQQKHYGGLKQALSKLTTQFSNNVLDATQGWYKHIEDEALLKGIPEMVKGLYQHAAQQKALEGWVITLDAPAYVPLMQYAENENLRQEMYEAFVTRASDVGPMAGQWDNSEIMSQILLNKQQLSELLGFANFSDYSLASKMADNAQQVLSFLQQLAEPSLSVAKREFSELETFAAEQGCAKLDAWDVAFYSEKLKQAHYEVSQQQVREYFPVDTVISGLFTIVSKLFSIDVERQQTSEVWHPDVRLYSISKNGEVIAQFYFDVYARENKRGGAWMADSRSRRSAPSGELQLPVAYLVCNFTPPTDQMPSLLTHQEVTTLFHEFGHGLHHMLTQIDVAAVSGINGVAWDAVELPSQFLENWCWQPESLGFIAKHYQTGQLLPEAMLEKMLAAKNFQSGMQMLRQLEFAMFDMQLHSQTQQQSADDIAAVLAAVRDQIAVYEVPSYYRFQHGFSHIFAGGYAAGYYSYKWAEVLAADAFSVFEEQGVFSKEAGEHFLREVLSRGGSAPADILFLSFRGREPKVDALLKQSGIAA